MTEQEPRPPPKVSLSLGGTSISAGVKRKLADLGDEEDQKRTRKSDDDEREEITDFNARKKKAAPLVIPLIEKNVWRNLEVSADATGDSAQPTPSTRTPAPLLATYGLVVPQKSIKVKEEKDVIKLEDVDGMEIKREPEDEDLKPRGPVTDADVAAAVIADLQKVENGDHTTSDLKNIIAPILQQNSVPGVSQFATDEEKYRHDVAMRPDEATLEDYEKVPVDQFGAALLRGMGWKEGQGIGRNKKNAWVVSLPRLILSTHLG